MNGAGGGEGQYHPPATALSAAAMVAAATATATATASVVALHERQDMNSQFGQVSLSSRIRIPQINIIEQFFGKAMDGSLISM